MRAFVLLIVTAFLSACGPPLAWERPSTSASEARVDAAECRRLAQDQAFRESLLAFPTGPHGYFPSRIGRRPYDPFFEPSFRRELRESELRDFCLRSRGYRLVPVQQ